MRESLYPRIISAVWSVDPSSMMICSHSHKFDVADCPGKRGYIFHDCKLEYDANQRENVVVM